MRISDWSSDVCSSDLDTVDANTRLGFAIDARDFAVAARMLTLLGQREIRLLTNNPAKVAGLEGAGVRVIERVPHHLPPNPHNERYLATKRNRRSEEHTSELQSLMRISYAVFCLKKKRKQKYNNNIQHHTQ